MFPKVLRFLVAVAATVVVLVVAFFGYGSSGCWEDECPWWGVLAALAAYAAILALPIEAVVAAVWLVRRVRRRGGNV